MHCRMADAETERIAEYIKKKSYYGRACLICLMFGDDIDSSPAEDIEQIISAERSGGKNAV